jgi:hypothetical protein
MDEARAVCEKKWDGRNVSLFNRYIEICIDLNININMNEMVWETDCAIFLRNRVIH